MVKIKFGIIKKVGTPFHYKRALLLREFSSGIVNAIWVAMARQTCFSRQPGSASSESIALELELRPPIADGAVHISTYSSCLPSDMNLAEEYMPTVRGANLGPDELGLEMAAGILDLNSTVRTTVANQLTYNDED